MGKANCEENGEFSAAINLYNRHAKALRKAEKSAANDSVRRLFLAGLLACQEANVKLVRMQERHQKRCEECKKGD